MNFKLSKALTFFSLMLVIYFTIFATNGDIMIAITAKTTGLAGTDTAFPVDSSAVLRNPANLYLLENSRADLGAALFQPPRYLNYASGLHLKSFSNNFTIPASGLVMKWPEKDITFAVGSFGISGMGVDFPQTAPGTGITSLGHIFSNLQQMEFGFGISKKQGEKQAIGFTIIGVYQSLQMNMPFANNPMVVQMTTGTPQAGAQIVRFALDQQAAMGYRFLIGKHYQLNDKLHLGISYKTKSFMNNFKWQTDNFGALTMNLKSPAITSFGISYQKNKKLRYAFDVKYIEYKKVMDGIDIKSDTAGVFNNYTAMVAGMMRGTVSPDGKVLTYPFKWKNQLVTSFAIEYRKDDKWTWRTGVNYAENPLRNDYLMANIPAMAVSELHYTFGGTYRLKKRSEISFAYCYSKNINEENLDAATVPYLQSLNMKQKTIAIEYSFLFK
jgi:long-chain fatty acid transport protein